MNFNIPKKDILPFVLVSACSLLILFIFLWIIWQILFSGLLEISDTFLFEPPSNSGREGGIASILVSTFLILGVCIVASVPFGLFTAIFLNEYVSKKSRLASLISRCIEVLAGVPSIVFGLFGHAFFSVYLGLGFSILSGGLTLACMILPLIIKSVEEGLKNVPSECRLSAEALALSKYSTIRYFILPLAMPACSIGVILGVGRAIAETAALVFTSGYVDRMPESLLDSGRSLSIHIYDLSMNVPGGNQRALATAAVLLAILLIINKSTSLLTRIFHKNVYIS